MDKDKNRDKDKDKNKDKNKDDKDDTDKTEGGIAAVDGLAVCMALDMTALEPFISSSPSRRSGNSSSFLPSIVYAMSITSDLATFVHKPITCVWFGIHRKLGNGVRVRVMKL